MMIVTVLNSDISIIYLQFMKSFTDKAVVLCLTNITYIIFINYTDQFSYKWSALGSFKSVSSLTYSDE